MKKNIVLLVLIFVLTNYHATEYQPTYSDTLMMKGTKQYKEKDYLGAIANLDSCIRLNPINDECLFYRAKIAYDMKEYKLSIGMFKSVVSLAEKDPDAWNFLGLNYQELKLYDTAELCFKNAVKLNPKESKFFANWGKNEFLRGNLAHAEDLYNTAIFLDPNYANHLLNRSEVLIKLGKKDEAIKDLDLAKEIDPENTQLNTKLDQLGNSSILSFKNFAILFLLIQGVLIWIKRRKAKI